MSPAGKSGDRAAQELAKGARSGLTTSPWMDVRVPPLRPLDADARTDVCVIGAGISGLTAALHLLQGGRRVMVIDDGPIGGGESARTTAHVTAALDSRYHDLEKRHGERAARLAAASHRDAIDTIAGNVERESIDCDFARVPGYLFQSDVQSDELERELEAAQRAGLEGVRLLQHMPWSSAPSWPCLEFPEQAQMHMGKYLLGLAAAVERLGGVIHTGTRAEEISGEGPLRVRTAGKKTIEARDVVHATFVPVDASAKIYLKEFPYRTYVIGAAVPKGAVKPALYWDTEDPYHYARIHPREGDDLLIVGGEDHPTGKARDAGERIQRLELWAREHFPETGAVEFRWSGQIFEPVDGLALIGKLPGAERQYVITGHSGNGVTYGTLGGRLVADLILERGNAWSEIYDPDRMPKAMKSLVEMALPAAKGYTRALTAGRHRSGHESDRGEIVRMDREKVARYRGPDGKVTLLSAACTHRGCIVDWNEFEQTWDCRCHGSRFATNGEVLTGPATKPLEPYEPKAGQEAEKHEEKAAHRDDE